MNERIRELAILARKFATSRDPFDEYDVAFDETKFEQKFAELIVKECLAECWYDNTPKQISDNIKTKFGVE